MGVTQKAHAFVAVPFATSDENTPQHCERKDPYDPNSEEICIPLPSVPAPSPQPQPAPGGSTQAPDEHGHEAWESPNTGSGDSGSSMPDKPEKPVQTENPAKPGKEPGSSDSGSSSSDSRSKKPSGSSSSDSGSGSSGGSKRPETVCGGEFCGGDTLIGGTGNANDRWPGKNKPGESNNPSVSVTRPADENTPADRVGTVVDTADGLAVQLVRAWWL